MSIETTTATEAPKTAKKASTKKAAPKKSEKAPAAKKTGLSCKPQIRILKALTKTNNPLSRKQISEKAGVDQAFLVEYLGSEDKEIRAKNDAKLKSLKTWGYVKSEISDVNGRDTVVYSATANGKVAYAKIGAQ